MDSKDIVLIDDQVINNIRDILIDRNETLAIAESVTCGILQTAFGSATDASLFFQGGITAYNLVQKSRHLHINPIHAQNCDFVSDAVAKEMAVGVCSLFASHWGIAVTGYATIDPEIKMDRPFAHFSIAHKVNACFMYKSMMKFYRRNFPYQAVQINPKHDTVCTDY